MAQMHKRMAELIVKQLTGEISEEETIELNRMGAHSGLDPKLLAELPDIEHLAAQLRFLDTFDEKTSWKKFESVYSVKPKTQIVREIGKLAAVVIFLALLTWLFLPQRKQAEHEPACNSTAIIPDTNRFIEFHDSDVQTILKQLEPEVDYVVEYTRGIRPRKYSGLLYRTTTIETLAEFIEMQTGKPVTVKGKKFIVHL